MRLRDVDIEAGLWTIPDTKQKRPHIVPLPRQALTQLRTARSNNLPPDSLIFGSTRGHVLSNWDRETKAIQRTSGTSAWHRHDVRRSVASLMGDIGVAPHVIEVALGHALRTSSDGSSLSGIAATYNLSRYRSEHAQALQQLADELDRIENGAERAVTDLAMRITDAATVERSDDSERLRIGLARIEGMKPEARTQIEKLAGALLESVRKARTELPPMKVRASASSAKRPRKRQPGGGRKRNEAKAILALDVARAMKSCGLSTGRWHMNGIGEASLYLKVVGLCWEVASGQPRGADDVRRLVTNKRRWEPIPERRATKGELRRAGLLGS
jgi:hypothetical protein